MRGNIRPYQTKTGTAFEFLIELGRDATGKRVQKRRRGFPTAEAAEAAMQEELVGRRKGTWIDPDSTPLADYLEQWLEAVAPSRAPSTMRTYTSLVHYQIAPHLGTVPLGKLQSLGIQRWANARAAVVSPRTLHGAHSVLSGALKDAVRWKLIPDNPARGCRLPRPERPDKPVLTAEQARSLLSSSAARSDRHAALWRLLLDSGMRIGEALALRWSDVDPTAATVTIRRTATRDADGREVIGADAKTAAGRRTVRIAAETVAALRAHKTAQTARRLAHGPGWHDIDLAFDRGDGRLCSRRTIAHNLELACDAAGLPALSPHCLRHTCATLLILAGVPLAVVSARLGHKGIGVTVDIYSHVTADADRQAADVLAALLSG